MEGMFIALCGRFKSPKGVSILKQYYQCGFVPITRTSMLVREANRSVWRIELSTTCTKIINEEHDSAELSE